MNPTYILLDEPGAGLNEEEVDELLKVLVHVRECHNLGMLVVEHDMRLIMRLCDRLHVFQSGKTIGEGIPTEICGNPAVIEAYLGYSRKEKSMPHHLSASISPLCVICLSCLAPQ